jgi:hypothetical protein
MNDRVCAMMRYMYLHFGEMTTVLLKLLKIFRNKREPMGSHEHGKEPLSSIKCGEFLE